MSFEEIQFSPEEWSNIPKLLARFCIRLTKQLHAITEYTQRRSGEETTRSLRHWATEEIKRGDSDLASFTNLTTARVEGLQSKDNMLNEYLDRVDADLAKFKNYLDEMKKPTISKLFSKDVTP